LKCIRILTPFSRELVSWCSRSEIIFSALHLPGYSRVLSSSVTCSQLLIVLLTPDKVHSTFRSGNEDAHTKQVGGAVYDGRPRRGCAKLVHD
jgi:hypothetical protein